MDSGAYANLMDTQLAKRIPLPRVLKAMALW